ncbi:MAG: hypothetical protein AAGE52_41290 [Myxococcota bacterium]
MRAVDRFDASDYQCGPATPAVQRLVTTFATLDWFEAPTHSADDAQARFVRYHELGRAWATDLFHPALKVELHTGGWGEFQQLCDDVRAPKRPWDWKYQILKTLSERHSGCFEGTKPTAAQLPMVPSASDLFVRFADVVVWNLRLPRLDVSSFGNDQKQRTTFYRSYCQFDLTEALDWQLADPSCRLDDNPFAVLMSVYAGGHYPFHLAADHAVLFSFSPPH